MRDVELPLDYGFVPHGVRRLPRDRQRTIRMVDDSRVQVRNEGEQQDQMTTGMAMRGAFKR